MSNKIGRNDSCPCGSGKKYKACCMLKKQAKGKQKLKATWINAPQGPNLMERTFGDAIASTGKIFASPEEQKIPSSESEKEEKTI